MNLIPPPTSIAEVRPTEAVGTAPPHTARKAPGDNSPAAAAAKIRAEQIETRQNDLLPADLSVRLDTSAERFVQTLTDQTTQETLHRYPSDAQLAFSRAVTAYLRAQIDR